MPQDENTSPPPRPNIVRSIFERPATQKISSLFQSPKVEKTLKNLQEKISSVATLKNSQFPLGVDIGTNSIKITQLVSDEKGAVKLKDWVVEELPGDVRWNPAERARQLPQILKKVLKQKKFSGDCYATAPWASLKISLIRLPQMPADEIDKAVRWELKQNFKEDASEFSLDYMVLDTEKASFLQNQIGVLAVTIPRKIILEELGLLESVGLNPLAIDAEPLANLAVLDYTKKLNPQEIILVLDLGAGKTSLDIICHGQLVSSRYLKVTGNSLTKAISEHCQISWDEAEKLKKDFGLSASSLNGPAPDAIDKAVQTRDAILPLLENMVYDINFTFKSFSYNMTQSSIREFNRVLITGGAATLKGLGSFLRTRLNVDIELVPSLETFQPAQPTDNLGSRLDVPLGLALRGLEE